MKYFFIQANLISCINFAKYTGHKNLVPFEAKLYKFLNFNLRASTVVTPSVAHAYHLGLEVNCLLFYPASISNFLFCVKNILNPNKLNDKGKFIERTGKLETVMVSLSCMRRHACFVILLCPFPFDFGRTRTTLIFQVVE